MNASGFWGSTEDGFGSPPELGPLIHACRRRTYWQVYGGELLSVAIPFVVVLVVCEFVVAGLVGLVFGIKAPLIDKPVVWMISAPMVIAFWGLVFWYDIRRLRRQELRLYQNGIRHNGRVILFNEIEELRPGYFESKLRRVAPVLVKVAEVRQHELFAQATGSSATVYLANGKWITLPSVLRIFEREDVLRTFAYIQHAINQREPNQADSNA